MTNMQTYKFPGNKNVRAIEKEQAPSDAGSLLFLDGSNVLGK